MVFIDGFNLYYPIAKYAEDNNANHLKWLNLRLLSELIAKRRKEEVVGIVYCSAYRKGDIEAQSRHGKYISALKSTGIKVVLGHYLLHPGDECSNCGFVDDEWSEKQSDINVALELFRAAYRDEYDVAYLLSADSDQAATSRHYSEQFPDKSLVSVTPPNQRHSKKVLEFNENQKYSLTMLDIERCRFPSIILRKEADPIRCPREYDLPPPTEDT